MGQVVIVMCACTLRAPLPNPVHPSLWEKEALGEPWQNPRHSHWAFLRYITNGEHKSDEPWLLSVGRWTTQREEAPCGHEAVRRHADAATRSWAPTARRVTEPCAYYCTGAWHDLHLGDFLDARFSRALLRNRLIVWSGPFGNPNISSRTLFNSVL